MSSRAIDETKSIASAVHELARLQRQVVHARQLLKGLQRSLAEVESGLESNAQLREANEHLIRSAVLARSHADDVKQLLEQVSRAAELDTLTKLPNRTLLLDRLTQAIAMAKRSGHRVALLFIDLDDFKQVNDKLGHAIGDKVLQLVAQCLTSAVRDADTVSRHGGDEFLILLPDLLDSSDALPLAEKVTTALASPMQFGDHVLQLAASIGISVYPDDGTEAGTLIHHADIAMYKAKRRRSGGIVFYDSELEDKSHAGP